MIMISVHFSFPSWFSLYKKLFMHSQSPSFQSCGQLTIAPQILLSVNFLKIFRFYIQISYTILQLIWFFAMLMYGVCVSVYTCKCIHLSMYIYSQNTFPTSTYTLIGTVIHAQTYHFRFSITAFYKVIVSLPEICQYSLSDHLSGTEQSDFHKHLKSYAVIPNFMKSA